MIYNIDIELPFIVHAALLHDIPCMEQFGPQQILFLSSSNHLTKKTERSSCTILFAVQYALPRRRPQTIPTFVHGGAYLNLLKPESSVELS